MSKVLKGILLVGGVAGAVAICVCYPPATKFVASAAVLLSDSAQEIITNEGHWPL